MGADADTLEVYCEHTEGREWKEVIRDSELRLNMFGTGMFTVNKSSLLDTIYSSDPRRLRSKSLITLLLCCMRENEAWMRSRRAAILGLINLVPG